MNIYDFDGTIYDGDSSVDFYIYCLKRNKKCLLILPKFALSILLYMIKVKDKEYLKSCFYNYLKYFDDIDKVIDDFWKQNEYKIKDFYKKQKKSTDIIITASPEFLIEKISRYLNFKLIGTKVNKKTGLLESKNCHDIEKVNRLKEIGINSCENFYSDSKSDTPLTKIAKKSFLVKKNIITKW